MSSGKKGSMVQGHLPYSSGHLPYSFSGFKSMSNTGDEVFAQYSTKDGLHNVVDFSTENVQDLSNFCIHRFWGYVGLDALKNPQNHISTLDAGLAYVTQCQEAGQSNPQVRSFLNLVRNDLEEAIKTYKPAQRTGTDS